MKYTQDTQKKIKANKHHSSLIIVPPSLLAGVENEGSLLLLIFAPLRGKKKVNRICRQFSPLFGMRFYFLLFPTHLFTPWNADWLAKTRREKGLSINILKVKIILKAFRKECHWQLRHNGLLPFVNLLREASVCKAIKLLVGRFRFQLCRSLVHSYNATGHMTVFLKPHTDPTCMNSFHD